MPAHTDSRDRGRRARSPWQFPLAAWKEVAVRTWNQSWVDNVGLVAAGVAFYGFLAMIPLFVMIVLIYGFFADPLTVIRSMQAMMDALPHDVALAIGEQLMIAMHSSGQAKGLGLLLALAFALYGASNGAGAVITALNIAYQEKEKRSVVRVYALAILMTLAAVLIALVALVATTAVAQLDEILPQASGAAVSAGRILSYAVLLLAAAAVAATLYRYGPSRENARWVWITPGSLFAAFGLLLLTTLFGFYLTRVADYDASYGSLSAIIALLTWIYLSAYVFMFGAELNNEVEYQTAEDSTTGPERPMGKRGAWAADHVANGIEPPTKAVSLSEASPGAAEQELKE
jgi:membrane protein